MNNLDCFLPFYDWYLSSNCLYCVKVISSGALSLRISHLWLVSYSQKSICVKLRYLSPEEHWGLELFHRITEMHHMYKMLFICLCGWLFPVSVVTMSGSCCQSCPFKALHKQTWYVHVVYTYVRWQLHVFISDYPWRFPNSTTDSNVVKWLYVPDFRTRPNSSFLICMCICVASKMSWTPFLWLCGGYDTDACQMRFLLSSFLDDFMLLLCASFQRQVFDDENKAAVRLMAGDNVEICRDLDAASFSVHNPVPDFIHCRYSSLHWHHTAAGSGQSRHSYYGSMDTVYGNRSQILYFNA